MEGWAVSRMAMLVTVTLCCSGCFTVSSTHSYRHTANATVMSTDFLTIGTTSSRQGHRNTNNNKGSTSDHSNMYNISASGHSNNSSTSGHSNNSSTSGHSNNSSTSDHSNNSSTTGHSNNSSTNDHSNNNSTSGYSNNSSTNDHSNNSSTSGYGNNSSTSGHSNNSSTNDHSNNSSTSDHSNSSSTSGYSNNSSTSGHSNNSSTSDHSNNSSTNDHSNNSSTSGHSNNSSTNGHSNNSSTNDHSSNSSTSGHNNTHINSRNIFTVEDDDNNISKELTFLETDSLCPGAADYLSNQTERNVLRVRVRDCWNTSRDSRAQHGVVYGLCNDSTSFCQFLVQVPHGMIVRANFRFLEKKYKHKCLHPWRTDVYVDRPQSPVSSVPDVSMKCHCRLCNDDRFILSRSNQLFVSHHNRPMLQIRFQAVKPMIETVYTSHHKGHVTLFTPKGNIWDIEMWSHLQVPEAHVVMISFERLHGKGRCVNYVELHCQEQDATRETVSRVYNDLDRTANIYYTHRIEIHFGLLTYPLKMLCVKMLFSFHAESNVPQRLASGLFNCSVDHYQSFRQHLDCNTKFQCDDDQDETAHCPFSNTACNGLVASDDKCYKLVRLQQKVTPRGAENECHTRGMELASLRSLKEVDDFQKLFQKRDVEPVLTGLVGWRSIPFMYRQLLTWSKTTLIYNLAVGESKHIGKSDVKYYSFSNFMGLNPIMKQISGLTDNFACERYFQCPPSEPVEYVADSVINFTRTTQTLLACPDGHMTHAFLSCDHKSGCGQTPCVFFTQKRNCSEVHHAVQNQCQTVAMFTCSTNAMALSYTLVCDFREDCQDRSDESFCVHPPCEAFQCQNGQCVPSDKRCNTEVDCLDDSDEDLYRCHFLYETMYPTQHEEQHKPLLINLDGKGWFSQRVMNTTESCPGTHYRCPTAWLYCLPVYTRCNGLNDCINREDERDCEKRTCPGLYRCRDSAVCLHADHLCDGWPQCPQRDDEWLCDVTCPAGCLCQGHAFLCPRPFSAHLFPQLRSLDARHSGMTPLDLMNNTYIVHLNLAYSSVRFLPDMVFPNIQIIDLSYNKLTSILMNAFVGLQNLKLLFLKGNPLISLTSKSSSLQQHALTTIDLSGTHLSVFDSETISHFRDIQRVNLSFSAVHSIGPGGFSSVVHLKELDIRGNLITEFPINMFVGLNELSHVFSSNYRLCCQDVLPKHFPVTNCIAPQPYLSSCEHLLLFGIYRLSFWFVGILATLGGVACFTGHVLVKKPFRATVAMFVANLQCANFCTGVYAVVIAAAHETFRGQYLHHEDKWTDSFTCKMAGFLSLLSSEVSVLIIWLLSLDQVIFLCFPSTSYRFNKRSAGLACGVTWVVGILLASTPLLPGLSPCWRYGQTAVCSLMLHDRHCMTQNAAFIVATIMVNFLLCLMVFAGQLIVLKTLPKHRLLLDSSKRTAYSSADLLMKVALTDAVSWFIITVTKVMTLAGVGGSELDVAMAVFMLPLNSALNPLLCLWHAATDRRRQEREERLLRVLKARLKSVSNRTIR